MNEYFTGPDGRKYYYADLGERIRADFPEMVGRHISVQLEALGLFETFQAGNSIGQLPYTFA